MSCVSAGLVEALNGVQEPRVEHVPPASTTVDAADAVELAASYGLTPDPWQERVLRGWLGRRGDGKWSSPRCGLAVPRQNGKNALLEIRELFGMIMLGETFVHSAHEVKTARKAFKRLQFFFGREKNDPDANFPELNALVAEIRNANGQEAIVLLNGGSVEFVARSKGSGRGFTVDVIVLDEAQELSDDALAALMPTRSAAPSRNPQMIFTGTPPAPNMNGEVFTRTRTGGVRGDDARLCWHEWSCEGEPDPKDDTKHLPVDIADRGNWAKANPALGDRLDIETIEDELAQMDEDKFGRERLGIWDDAATGDSGISKAQWQRLEDPTSTALSASVFSVAVALDRSWSSIGMAGPREDGLTHLEMVDRRRGTGWVVDRCVELNERWAPAGWVVDGVGPGSSLITAMENAGLNVITASTADVARAYSQMVDGTRDSSYRHGPQEEVDTAVEGARKRPIGDGGHTFGRRASDVELSPLECLQLANWGHNEFGPVAAGAYLI